eukprot:6586023-Pyramimonas_sp.AAC.1
MTASRYPKGKRYGHHHIGLDLKLQSDVVNCGAWVRREAALKGCPTLRAIVYLEDVGVTIGREGGNDNTYAEGDVPELRTAILELAQLRQFNQAYASGPGAILQELGLQNMEDFVSYDGMRLLTLPEMGVRHVGKKFGPEQWGSLLHGYQ